VKRKDKMKFNLRKKLIIGQISLLVFSLASVFTATYAWYTANRQTSLSISHITAESGMDYTLKYFIENEVDTEDTGTETDGYLSDDDTIAVTDYSTDFIEVEDPETSPFYIQNMSPKTRYTYSIEVTAGFAATSLVRLDISDFVNTISTIRINENDGTGVTLASAINFYGTCVDYNSSNITAYANSFVTSSTLFDKFDYDNDGEDSQELASGLLGSDYPTGDAKIVFFFTIEFSNEDDTFLSEHYVSEDLTTTYFVNDPTDGNSNAYGDSTMDFTLSELELTKDEIGEVRLDTRGGTLPVDGIDELTGVSSSDSISTLPVLTKTGYTFGGWYDDVNKTTIASGATWTVPTNVPSTLFALWTANTQTVTYDATTNGGTTTATTVDLTYDTSYPHFLPSATKSLYTFDGWFLDPVATTNQVEKLDIFKSTSNLTLYAQFTIIPV